MVDPRLLEILVCPRCKGELDHRTQGDELLICRKCSVGFPVRDDIPVMLMEEAVPFEEGVPEI
jgi:uncharacterized protein YbaR (Trm112 family)